MRFMNAQTSAPSLPQLIAGRLAGDSLVRNAAVVVTASLLLALSAQVAIPVPFSPVPLTLQPLALLLLGAALGPARAAVAVALYILEGAAGLPVFAQGRGGMAVLVGPTAGYIFAFPFAAFIAGWVARNRWTRSPLLTIPGMALALASIHVGGWAWLAGAWGLGAQQAFAAGVAPFLVNDVVKVLIAAALLPMAERIVARFSR